MARTLAVLMAMSVLVAAAAPAAADETVLAPTTFNADGGSATTPALEAGSTYRLDVGGTFQEVGPNITFDHDAAYCFSDNATIPICRGDESLSQTALFAAYQGSSFAPFYELGGGAPPYAASHRYGLTFTAGQSVPLVFRANTPEVGREYPGQLAVAVYKVVATTPPPSCRSAAALAFASACDAPPTPLTETPEDDEEVSYAPPPPGSIEAARGAAIPRKARKALVDVDDPLGTILAVQNLSDDVCLFAFVDTEFKDLIGRNSTSSFSGCKKAVQDILFKCITLKVQRGGPGVCGGPAARAAAGGCLSATVSASKAKATARCRATATGIRLTLKPRKGKTLRKALGRQPKFIFAAPVGAAIPPRVNVTWRVS